MAAVPQISAKAMDMIDYIHERMTMIVPQIDDIHNLTQSNVPNWDLIEERITDIELEILYAREEANALLKLANTEGFPVNMKNSINEQAVQLSDIFRVITSIKKGADDAGQGNAAAGDAVQAQLGELLPRASGVQILVASFRQQVAQHGGSRTKRFKRTMRFKRSKQSKRTKRSKQSKRKQRTHRK
jgi:hypothetical protein